MYLVTLFRLGGKRGGGGGSKSLVIRTLHALIAAPAQFFLVSSLWPFYRCKISISVAYDLIDFPLFYRFPAFYEFPPPSLSSPTSLPLFSRVPAACSPPPQTKMTSEVQLRLVLQRLCDHVKQATGVICLILLNSFNLILKIVAFQC